MKRKKIYNRKLVLLVYFLSFVFQKNFAQSDSVYFGKLAQQFRTYLNSNLDSAKIVASKINNEATAKQYTKGMGLGANYIGLCHLTEGRYDSAVVYFNRAIKFYGAKNFSKGLCDAYSNLGICYDYQGNFPTAIQNHLKALKIAEIISDENTVSRASNNLGTVFYQQRNFKMALGYFERSLKIREEKKDVYGIASCCLNIASCLSELKLEDKSTYFLNKSISSARQVGDSALLADGYTSLAQNYSRKKDYKNAIFHYNKAVAIYKQFNDLRALSQIYSFMGINYGNLKEQKLSHQHFLLAYKLSTQIHNLEEIKASAAGLVVTYAYFSKPDSVAYFLTQYGKMRDTLYSASSSEQIADMQTKYETDKKDKEIKLKDLEIDKQAIESQKKSFQRNAFIIGFALMLGLSFFIYRGYRQKQQANIEINKQKDIIVEQKSIVEEKNKEITDSITYAQRIQQALLAGKSLLDKQLKNYFIFFQPKDIVSGDFYWGTEAHNKFYFIIADCTGHGVPGAFMSLLNISFLNEAINEKNLQKTNQILDHVRHKLIQNLAEDGSTEGGKDGMDCSLLCFDLKNNKLEFSCANNPIMIVRNNEVLQFGSDRMAVGRSPKENEPFTTHYFDLQKGDTVYAFTDGYPDQFGGPKGKKFKQKKLTEILLENSSNDLIKQQDILKETFTNWKGSLEQVDDVLVVGIKV